MKEKYATEALLGAGDNRMVDGTQRVAKTV